MIVHLRSRISVNPKASEIFAPLRAPGISCLLANTSNDVPFNSLSYISSQTLKHHFQNGRQLGLGHVQTVNIGAVHDKNDSVYAISLHVHSSPVLGK